MLGAVYLQTPDKRHLKIQYFFNFKCRVPMFEDPGAPYSWDKIPAGWPDRGLALMAIRKYIQFKHDEVIDQYASEHNRRFKFDWLFINTFTLDTRIPKNEFRQTIETDNLNRLCSLPWVNSHTDKLNFK